MTIKDTEFDDELTAIQSVLKALTPLEPDSRQRVVDYVTARFKISTGRTDLPDSERGGAEESENAPEDVNKSASDVVFETFADLFDAARPTDHGQKALVAGYWVQVHDGIDNFTSFSINKHLNNLGYRIPNITRAIDRLRRKTPALVVQLRKSGKSKQARKAYKVTDAGIKVVAAMINESS